MATLHGQLTRNAHRLPDKTALIFGDTEHTYRGLDELTDRYANALISLGVQKGDRVGLMSANSDRFLIAFYGALKAGAIVSPFNPRSTARELHYLLEDSGATVLLFAGATVAAVAGLDRLEPAPDVRILSIDGTDGYDDLHALAVSTPAHAPGVDVAEDDDCIIIYISGTTGRPKGAFFDHHRMLWVGHSVSALGLNIFDRQLHVAPLYHCAELVLFALSGLSLGTTHVVLAEFEPAAVADALAEHRISVFLGVPTMYQMMLRLPDLTERDLSAWRLGFFGAAPMPASMVSRLVETLPTVGFVQLCGPTEGGPTGMYSSPEDVVARPDATGRRPIPNAEVRVVTPDGDDVGPGETGEVIIRGETVMKGYWNKPDATAEAIRDGWLHTGDLATKDADGYMTLVDRLKDMIITGGRNVYSVEVENALAAHPDVLDVAVVSQLDEHFGETIVAVVMPIEGREVTLESLRAFAAEYISDYKLPRELVIRSIPRNPSGKILKHVLRAQVRGG
ncbi:AMP-binding protein [Gordonia sp. NB41Y]|uniref:class I adenylate-forming enzyme family protein n=1 Tax=Gordonia sp. NB41Y TaxID=875808 RepID=UPI0002BEE0A8|nr:AMP-binding protein [Gordonia sp. NB41Y]EMP14418.1 O-succinylbenzoate--CoA ligase [Gordonia sp. NB41Y]WLP91633.1 AMP-binding protein [Gordonia sp. NB41Y]